MKLQDPDLFWKGENFKPSFLGQGIFLGFLGLQGLQEVVVDPISKQSPVSSTAEAPPPFLLSGPPWLLVPAQPKVDPC